MKEVILKKQEEVKAVAEKMKNSAAVVAFKYQGLTVEAFQNLRREMRQNGCEVAVIKNNISSRAAAECGYGEFADSLVGPLAIAFAESDVVAPAKVLFKQASAENSKIEVIKGVVDGDVFSFEQLKELSVLPSYETLLTQLAAGMLGTLSQLSIGLNMLVEKGQEA
ncbi:MAG: 50S ribosomal protein L10 [Acholeplasmatales bacterium]|nr:50S ribosomal protein L10 [Acholeplasmatales bacterium]